MLDRGRFGKRLWLASGVAGTLVAASLYTDWERGFAGQLNDLEIGVRSSDGKAVDVNWIGPRGTEWPAAQFPLQYPSGRQQWHIRITALAQKNAASKGSEVWLVKLASPGQLLWRDFAPPPGWEVLDNNITPERNALAAVGAAPATVEVERTGGTLTLQFQRHDRGGLVQVTVNGNSRPVDLYAPEIGVETLTFLPAVSADQNPPELLAARTHGAPGGFRNFRLATDPPGHVEIQSVKLNGDRLTELSPGIYAAGANYWTARFRAILASLLTLVAVAATLLLVVLAWRRGAAAGDLLLRGAAIVSAVAISGFWTAVYYPFLGNSDTIDMWSQALLGRPDKWHPIGLTMLLRAAHMILPSRSNEFQMAPVAFLNGVALWCAIFALVSLAVPRGRARIVICMLAVVYYPIWPYTAALMKDTWFAVSVIGLLCVCRPVFFGEPFSWRRLAGASAFVGMGCLTRHNAGLVFFTMGAGAAIVLYCLRRRPQAKSALVFSVIALCAGSFFSMAVTRVCHAFGVGNLLNYYVMFDIAGTVHFTGKPIERFAQLQTYQAVGRERFERAVNEYTCDGSADYLVWGRNPPLNLYDVPLGRHDGLLDDSYAIQDMPILALGFPSALARHKICILKSLLQWPGRELARPLLFPLAPNRFNIVGGTLLPAVQAPIQGFWDRAVSRPGPLQLPFRHVLLLIASGFASLLALIVSWFRRPAPLALMPLYCFAAGLAVLAPMLLVLPVGDWRYLMPSNLYWFISVLAALSTLLPQAAGSRTKRELHA
jgi:hypothetical protein